MPDPDGGVILGVDTHAETHTAAIIDPRGRLIATLTIPADARGNRSLLRWAREHGTLRHAGVEGTGSYGLSLARFLASQGVEVIEVTRAARKHRRHLGKNDTRDAEAAARAVLAGEATALPKPRSGIVESIRVLRLTRASAVKARTQTALQLRNLIVTAPDELREPLIALTTKRAVERCARLRRNGRLDAPSATRTALRTLARRWQALNEEVSELDADLKQLTRQAAPRLLAEAGIGPETAAKLLIVAGDNPDRVHSDAALAALCGSSPVEASSGKTRRHRLNRGGDRQGNNALWTIATNRMLHHPETRAYVERRTQQGLSTKEIRRCLMRHLARRLHPLLRADLTDALVLGAPTPDQQPCPTNKITNTNTNTNGNGPDPAFALT
jgi:transposase